jgi:hypothetical protein
MSISDMRTLVDIPNRQLDELSAICAARSLSRAEVVRQAIDAFIRQNRPSQQEAFGIWKDRHARVPVIEGASTLPEDGLAYQERLRGEW